MTVRTKLNSAYLIAIATISGFAGLFSHSITVFIICFGVLAFALIHDGAIRLKPTRH